MTFSAAKARSSDPKVGRIPRPHVAKIAVATMPACEMKYWKKW